MLRAYHATMGALIAEHGGTVDRFAGDGILIFFNDPLPVPDAAKRAASMALAMQEQFRPLRARWSKLGYELDLGIGIAQGFATLGAFGYEGRVDYTAIGSVVNLAHRLCNKASAGEVLIDRKVRAALDDDDAGGHARPAHPQGLRPAGAGVPAAGRSRLDAGRHGRAAARCASPWRSRCRARRPPSARGTRRRRRVRAFCRG